MPEQTVSKATLIALLLPPANAAFIRNLRTCLWQATGNCSFLSIFPIIPLRWISPEARIPKTFHIPPPSFLFEIQRIPLVVDDSLLLPINQIVLNSTQKALRQFITEYEAMRHNESLPVPFPDGGLGVYLGKTSETALKTIEQFPMVDSSLRIHSAKLGILELESDDFWLATCRYRLLHIRNLAQNHPKK